MEYVKIGGVEYPAEITGKTKDYDWNERQTKTIKLEMDHATAAELFVDGVKWSIILETGVIDEETGEEVPSRAEFDNSEYRLAGPITDHRDGTLSITMGKLTDLEIAYELLYGGDEE